MGRSSAFWVALGLFALSGCAQEVIAHQQLEREANKMLTILRDNGLDAVKQKDEESRELRFNVLVPQDQTHSALTILEDHNLPEVQKTDSAVLAQAGGLIPTAEQEIIKKQVGVEGDLINALRKLPRVIDVQASVNIPRDNPLRDPNDPVPVAKASVIVVYTPDGSDIPPVTTEDVQRFVQAKLEGLKAENVSVLLIPSKVVRPSEGGTASAGVGRVIDPAKGCEEKEKIFNLDVCAGNKKKVIQILVVAGMIAGLTSGLAVVAVLRMLRYRKEYTKLTAQFAGLKK